MERKINNHRQKLSYYFLLFLKYRETIIKIKIPNLKKFNSSDINKIILIN